jgi:hypothetical protein
MNIRGFSFKYTMFAAFLGLASTTAHAEVVDRVEAIVNKKAIYKSDVDQFRKLLPLRAKVDPIFSNDPIAKKANQTDEEIVEFLINETIITEKFPVADADVEQEINGIQGNLHIEREALRSAIAREGFKFEDYFQLMRVSLSKRQLIDREIRNKAAVSEDDLRAEYSRSRSGSKSFRGSFHVFLLQIPKSKFKTAKLAREEAQRALDELKKGTAFEEVSKKYNDDNDGNLGFLSYSDMFPALQKEVQKLGPQKTSDIFDDGKNYSIVKVGEVKADDDAGFSKEKDQLRGKLLEHEFQHQIQLWLTRQRALNYVKINAKKP